MQSDALGKLAIPLEALLGWIMVVPRLRDDVDAIWDRVRNEPRKDEVVWLSNGDRLSGGFLGYGSVLKLQVRRQAARDRPSADRGGGLRSGRWCNYARPKSGFLEFLLQRRHAVRRRSTARIDESNVEATARFGGKVRFPLGELVWVHVRSASYVYLSERKPPEGELFSVRRPDPRVSARQDDRRPSVRALAGQSV